MKQVKGVCLTFQAPMMDHDLYTAQTHMFRELK